MSLRFLPFAAVLLLGSTFTPAQKLTLSPAGIAQADLAARSQTLSNLLDEIWQDQLSHSPLLASSIGDKRYDARLPDYSVATYNDQLASDAQFVARLAAVDTAGMSEQQILSRNLMIHELMRAQEASQFKPWATPVSAFSGLPATLPRLAAQLRFTSAQDYDDYANRLDQAPSAFRQITDNIMIGIEDQRVPPKSTLEELLARINALLAVKPEDSAFAAPLQEFPASISAADQASLRQEVLTAISTQVYPAYQRFAKFLQAVYIPAARAEPGLWALPDGEAWYAFLVKQNTTTDLTAAQLHEMGQNWVARDEAAELALAKKLGYPTPAALRTAMAADPHLHPASGEQLLSAYRADLTQMRAKLPGLFTAVPPMPLTVEAMPAWMAAGQGSAYYEPKTLADAGGTIDVNTTDLQHRSLADVESIVYDRFLPGEAFQTSLARQLTSVPEFRRWLAIPAFTEGWGLYADQQLGPEAGFYQDPYSDFARLESDEQASIALVVDTGIHADRWTRQQAMDYYHAHSGLSGAAVETAVDRVIAEPGAALAAKAGELEILGLRAAAQKTLGARFNLAAFDQEIVGSGPLPLDMLLDRMAGWMNGELAEK